MIGIIIYLIIGAIGALGIIGRKASVPTPLTLNDYFKYSSLPPLIVELIYLAHLVSWLFSNL